MPSWGGSKEGVGAGGCSFVYHIPSCIIIGLGTGVHLLGDSHGTFNQLRYHEHGGTGTVNDLRNDGNGA
ncbi:hypothetical protein M440DRAFT_71133 [Trichoderma longibrachiatum ATCC 18648]|uniref:Uncharacterized protein n=1 Tax=Trichoderma longibrachiatum ATCC 18648 TaxID=983965 RepID=A0A2T4CH66_TRILO|nr:hypothetical protein M440DRAFT_71133 [Trichoderma longibrachiatum ATCC 18648]